MPSKRRLAKKKRREKEAHQRVLRKRKLLREEVKLEREVERLKWEYRERIIPIRKNKEVEE